MRVIFHANFILLYAITITIVCLVKSINYEVLHHTDLISAKISSALVLKHTQYMSFLDATDKVSCLYRPTGRILDVHEHSLLLGFRGRQPDSGTTQNRSCLLNKHADLAEEG
jgi:hypothetical protein